MDVTSEKDEKREYELAVIAANEADEVVFGAGIEMVQKEGPKPIALAYPIKKHLSAYMRVYVFRALPADADLLNKSVEADQSILRHLMITPAIAVRRESRAHETRPRAEAVRPNSPEAVSNAALEAALETIQGTDESK